jgi:lipoyl(octanoyl) transferase
MLETWFVLQSGLCPPAYNMAMDEALLEQVPRLAQPVLRFYGWTIPAATFGYSQRYADVSSWTSLRPLIRRTTGGGLVPHDFDWTYSLAFPVIHAWYRLKAVESYRAVHEWVQRAFARVGVEGKLALTAQKSAPGQCFIGAEQFDLLLAGAKIAGAAQRRTKSGLLIQGSVQPRAPHSGRAPWEQAMLATMAVQWDPLTPDATLTARVQALATEKYEQERYNEKR